MKNKEEINENVENKIDFFFEDLGCVVGSSRVLGPRPAVILVQEDRGRRQRGQEAGAQEIPEPQQIKQSRRQ